MYIISSEIYNNFLEIYYDEYNELADDERNEIDPKYNPKTLFPDGYDCSVWP